MSPGEIGLPEALERAARALPRDADAIRPANGDPHQLQRTLAPAAALRVLSWLLHHEPEAGAELAGAWAEDPERGAPLLQQIEGESLPKPARKALRRTLHQLRSRGVPVAGKPPEPVVAKLPPIGDALDEAMLTPIDPLGSRGVYLAMSHPSGGARLFELVVDDARGVLDFHVYSAGRSQVRRFLRNASRRERFAALAAPPESVRVLIARAVAQQASDRPLPRGFSEWRPRLCGAPDSARTPGELVRDALGAGRADDAARLARAAERVARRELGPWPPPEAELRAVAGKVKAETDGVLAVSEALRRERTEQALIEAAGAVYGERFAALTAERLEESAYVLWRTGRKEDARDCLAAAAAFRELPPPDNPVARALLERMLAPVLSPEPGEGGERAAPRVIEP